MAPETRRTRRHPGDGVWRAFTDGELALGRRLLLHAHTLSCHRCRARLAQVQRRGERTRTLLGELPGAVNVADGWARFGVLSGGHAGRGRSRVPAFLAGGLSMAALAASVLLVTPAPTRLLGRVHGIGTFANVLDRCCSDMAGVGVAQEGELTLDVPGVEAPVTVQYTDVDGSGSLSTGDIVRSVSRRRRRTRRPRRRSPPPRDGAPGRSARPDPVAELT